TITGSDPALPICPEKPRLARVEDEVGQEDCTATRDVREVVYLGALTRYIVDLDGGGQLVVTQQNLATSSMEALQVKGRAVRLLWDARLNRSVEEGRP